MAVEYYLAMGVVPRKGYFYCLKSAKKLREGMDVVPTRPNLSLLAATLAESDLNLTRENTTTLPQRTDGLYPLPPNRVKEFWSQYDAMKSFAAD